MNLLEQNNTLILIIDIQDKLVTAVNGNQLVDKAVKLINATNFLNIPLIISEQYPKGLGATVSEILSVLTAETLKFEKTSFSLVKENGFLEKLKLYNKEQIIICGIEAHICVYQTAVELINNGFDVVVAKDICASRNDYEYNMGIELMKAAGAKISCLEIILFELLKSSKHAQFKDVQSLIK